MPPKAREGLFPLARIKRIMQVDKDIGQIAKDTPPVVSAVLQQYLKELMAAAAECTKVGGGKVMKPAHLKAAVASDPKFDSLKDLVKDIPNVGTDGGVAQRGPARAAANATVAGPAGSTGQTRPAPAKPNSARQKKRKRLTVEAAATTTAPSSDSTAPANSAASVGLSAASRAAIAAAAPTGSHGRRVGESALTKAVRVAAQVARAAQSDDDYDDESE